MPRKPIVKTTESNAPHAVIDSVKKTKGHTPTVKVIRSWTVKCQLGNFESLELTEGIEMDVVPEQYVDTVRYCEDEIARRLGHTGKRLLHGLVLPNEGRSVAGQLAIRLQDGKVVTSEDK